MLIKLVFALAFCLLIRECRSDDYGINIDDIPCHRIDQFRPPQLRGDNGFGVEIEFESENEGFESGRNYSVTLSAGDIKDKMLEFEAFRLSAVFEYDRSTAGSLMPMENDASVIESKKCENFVESSNWKTTVPSVSLQWKAPNFGKGCVLMRALIVLRGSKWFAYDNRLTKRICPTSETGKTKKCCACGSATYDLEFQGLWSKETHPEQWPPESLLHWGDFVGAVHSSDYHVWKIGGYSGEGMKQMALYGTGSALEQEISNHSMYGGTIRELISMKGLWTSALFDKTKTSISLSPTHHLVSLATMIGPSPDWFTGIDGIDLCGHDCIWQTNKTIHLQPIDAGVDSGLTYVGNKKPTIPQEMIKPITSSNPSNPISPFFKPGTKIPPMARLTLKQTNLRGTQCPNGIPDPSIKTDLSFDEQTDQQIRMAKFKKSAVKASKKAQKPYTLEIIDDQINAACTMGKWTEWSDCSSSCGNGYQLRTRRYLIDFAKQQILGCSEKLQQRRSCFSVESCRAGFVPVDHRCKINDWSEWSECSAACGLGTMERTREVFGKNEDCAEIQKVEKRSCTGKSSDCDQGLKLDMFEKKRICMQPKQVGKCKDFRKRYYLDFDLRKCTEFRYGGCDGNENNFETVEECENVCDILLLGRTSSGSDSRCVTTPWSAWSECSVDCGTGVQSRFRFYKSKPLALGFCGEELEQSRSCRGSCSGNQRKSEDDCLLLVEPGLCKQNHTRYYYDSSTGKCMMFIFGGCNGNGNNFFKKSDCENVCGNHMSKFGKANSANAKCSLHPWSPWSKCFHENGQFVRKRTRFYVQEGDDKSDCSEAIEEKVLCGKRRRSLKKESCCECGIGTYRAKIKDQSSMNDEVEMSDIVAVVHNHNFKMFNSTTGLYSKFLRTGDLNELSDKLKHVKGTSKQIYMVREVPGIPLLGGNVEIEFDLEATNVYKLISVRSALLPTEGNFIASPLIDLCDQNHCKWKSAVEVELTAKDLYGQTVENGRPIGKLSLEMTNFKKIDCDLVRDLVMPKMDDPRCETRPWDSWSKCNTICGLGYETTIRQYIDSALSAKANCSERLRAKRVCLIGGCEKADKRCTTTDWSAWSPCSNLCGYGKSSRFRKYTAEQKDIFGCKEVLREDKMCRSEDKCGEMKMSKDICELELVDGSPCRSDILRYYYDLKTEKCVEFKYGGCRGNANNFESREACEAVCRSGTKCEYGPWSKWIGRCGSNIETREKYLVNGSGCDKVVQESRKCQVKICEKIDCKVGPWTQWSTCLPSGNGMVEKARTRNVEQMPANGGMPCPPLKEIRIC